MMELLGSEVNPAPRSDPNGLHDANTQGQASTQRKGNNVSIKGIRFIAAIGASAAVTVGAVAVGMNQDRNSLGTDVGAGMPTGATVTESVAPTTPAVPEATPGIKGPAPLPPEEQGL